MNTVFLKSSVVASDLDISRRETAETVMWVSLGGKASGALVAQFEHWTGNPGAWVRVPPDFLRFPYFLHLHEPILQLQQGG